MAQDLILEELGGPAPSAVLTIDQAKERFALFDPMDEISYSAVLLFEGDVTIKGDLCDWSKKLEASVEKASFSKLLFLINGNLTVEGDLDLVSDLFVRGDVHCDVLRSYDEAIYITGSAHIKYAFDGNYNDGCITIDGATHVPYVLNSDHDSRITPDGAVLINYFGDEDDFFEYDYTERDFERVMVPEVFDDAGSFKQWKFIDLLKEGKSPLRDDADPDFEYDDEDDD